ncbi:MAG: T9SS type A sorting domain-containing protein, partial [Pseudarcicella sp.]|nr:T9SS type A sorting domain-containing protein [Pseudarcicella sp.]
KAISQMVQSLDEPKNEKINLKISTLHKGFFTQQASGKNWDSDDYLLKIPQRGLLSFDMKIDGLSTPYFSIYSKSGELLYIKQAYETFNDKILINKDDELSVRLYGDSRGEVLSYELVFDFCKMPPIPKIQNTGYDYFCDNQPVTLQATQGYDTYQWLFNGNQYYSSQDNIQVNRTGIFSVSASICGINTASTNFISTTAIQSPNKPTLKKQEINDEVVLISSFPETNSWLHNGNKIYGVTSSTLIPNELGSYQVIAKKNGCSNTSDPVLLTMEKPTLNFQTNPFICNGESTTLIAPGGFKDYLYYENNNEIKSTKNELTITRPGVYSVKTKKGKFTSSASDPLIVSIVEKPLKPQLTLQYQGLKASNENTTYQWFNNGKIILDSTRQYLKNIESGIYSVRVEKNGCQTDSDPYEILSDDFPVNIYPNPSKGDFKVELPQTFSEWTLKLFNPQGKNIFTKIHENYFTNFENFNIKIDKGVYLLKIITPNGTKSETIIIE